MAGFILHIAHTHEHTHNSKLYVFLVPAVMCAHIWDPNMCAFPWTGSLLGKHSTFHSSASPEPRMGSEHCFSSKNYQTTCEAAMAVNSHSGRAETPCVRSGHPHSFCSNTSCFLHLYLFPYRAEQASPVIVHNEPPILSRALTV